MSRWVVDTGSADRLRSSAVCNDAGGRPVVERDGLSFSEAEAFVTRMRRLDAERARSARAERGRANLARWRARINEGVES